MRITLLLLFTLFSGLAIGAKDAKTIDQVYKLSPLIYDVKGIGEWKKGIRGGQIRLVITRTQKTDEMFLQWVQWNEKGPEKVRSTVALKEIQDEGNFKVEFIRRETLENSRQIILGLENQHDKSSMRAVIQVKGVGLYDIKFE